MLLILGPLCHPLAKDLDLRCRQLLAAVAGRHALVFVGRCDASNQFAVSRLAGDNGSAPLSLRKRSFLIVEAELGLASALVGAMAGEAILCQDRAHVAVK